MPPSKHNSWLRPLIASALWLAVGQALAQWAPPIANVVIGGAEHRCSSFTGRGPGPDCNADWDSILEQDPAFAGLDRDRISFEAEVANPIFHYRLSPESMDAIRDLPTALFDPKKKRLLLEHLGALAQDPLNQVPRVWETIEKMLPSALRSGADQLSLAEGAVLHSALVDRSEALPVRKLQARSTRFSSDAASVAITQSLVDAARVLNGGKRPLIGVVTASAQAHPFADRDINVFGLASAGADVVYLPLEGGLRRALDVQDCANLRYYYDNYANTNPSIPVYHADLLFPDLAELQKSFCADNAALLNATLERLNGIYFSGGDQARHLESLVGKDSEGRYTMASAQLRILQRRHAQGHLVVAGTSAGNHFQGGGQWRGRPVPMIAGGDAYDVLKAGFAIGQGPLAEVRDTAKPGASVGDAPMLYPLGGLGVFHFGVLDSHFSKRAREARLVRAVWDSGMDYGFGVDENTALLVSQADAAGATHFSVIGAGGVFIVDARQASSHADSHGYFSISNARAHYLLPGDKASIDAQGLLHVALDAAHPVLAVSASPVDVVQDQLLDYGSAHFLHMVTVMGLKGAQQALGTTLNSVDTRSRQSAPYYSAKLARDGQTVFRGRASVAGSWDRVSYTGLLLALAPCKATCLDP